MCPFSVLQVRRGESVQREQEVHLQLHHRPSGRGDQEYRHQMFHESQEKDDHRDCLDLEDDEEIFSDLHLKEV